MRKLLIGAIALLGYGVFFVSQSSSEPKACAFIKDDIDATQHGLKILDANPNLWDKHYTSRDDMRRAASYGHMGMPGRTHEVTFTGIKHYWTYNLNLECVQNGQSRYCQHVALKFDECGGL